MTKLKITGIIIFLLCLILAIVSKNISDHNKSHSILLETINNQKAFTQEISKNIFYVYKNKNSSTQQLESSIKKFLDNLSKKEVTLAVVQSPIIENKNAEIVLLWNKFYLDVQKFRYQSKVITPYTSVILEKTVNNIYKMNFKLIKELDKLITLHHNHYHKQSNVDKIFQYSSFLILLIAFSYFLFYISKTSNNFDILMKKIDNSIKSIDQIEDNAENILDNIELTEKEDAIIEALDELMISSIKLKKLKIDLENLNKLKDKN